MKTNDLLTQNEVSLKTLKLGSGNLDFETFRILLENAVIPTVDFIVRRPSDNTYLLITRVGSLWADARWFLGGRQRRGENVREALLRLAQKEIGLQEEMILKITFSHLQDLFNPPSKNLSGQELPATHTLMHIHVVDVKAGFEPKLDQTSKDPVWHRIGEDTPEVPDVVRYSLIQAGLIPNKS